MHLESKSTLEGGKNLVFEKNCSLVTAGKTMKVTADLLKRAKPYFEVVNPNHIGIKYFFCQV